MMTPRDARKPAGDPDRWSRLLERPAGEVFGELLASGDARRDGEAPDADSLDGASLVGRQVGPYLVERRLGAGGMGVVFAARQTNPDREVALKIMRAGVLADARELRLFRREVASLARLAHPGIAAIHDAGSTPDGLAYFAMELVQGEPLDTHLAGRPAPDTREEIDARLLLFGELCDAIAHAHQRGVVHLDLKPANILVQAAATSSRSGPASALKVLDFGVARLLAADGSDAHTLSSRGLLGTLAYMSPEQVLDAADAIDVRSDVYALGVLLHEMLTGTLPIDVRGLPLAVAIPAVCQREPARPGARSRLLRGDLETIILKALHKDPAQRYQGVAALADDVRRHREDLPILGRAPSTSYQLRKFARRHRVAIGVAAVVTASLLVAVAGTTAGLVRARRAEQLARAEAGTAEQVAGFLETVFQVADPGESRGNAVTARELLDRAAASIDQELADEPAVQGRLLASMGNAYRNLGLYRDARPLLERAVDLQSRTLADNDPRLGRAHFLLASLLRRLGDYDAAQSHYESALAVRERAFGPDHPDVGVSLSGLANLAVDRGDYQGARGLYARSLAILAANYGQDDPRYAAQLRNVAITELNAGELEQAREQFEQVLAIQRRTLAADAPELAATMGLLAGTCDRLEMTAEARKLAEEALRIQEAVLGPAHPDLTQALTVLANQHTRAGETTAAVATRQRIVDIWQAAGATASPGFGMALGNLAEALKRDGRPGEAVATFERAGAILTAALPPDHTAVIVHRSMLADLYMETGRLDLARPELAQAIAGCERAAEPDTARLAELLKAMAALERAEGHDAAAAALEARVLALDTPSSPH